MQQIPTEQQPTPQQHTVYPPQPPMYPPPQQPPRSHKRLWLILGIVAAILLVGGIIGGIAGSQGQSTSTPAAQPTQQVTTQPTQPPVTQVPQSNTIGAPVQVGDTWIVTVNSVKTSQGTEFITPKSGDTFLVIDVTLKNISASVQHASGLMQWSLRDDSGQRMQVSLMGSDPGGTVTAGNLVRGQLSYEVPVDQHHFLLQFVPDFSEDIAEWDVKV
jgi:hypothetical protein